MLLSSLEAVNLGLETLGSSIVTAPTSFVSQNIKFQQSIVNFDQLRFDPIASASHERHPTHVFLLMNNIVPLKMFLLPTEKAMKVYP
jgi:hypothetical protein